MIQVRKYNYCLDFIKGIACVCIVLMHCEFPGFIGIAVQAVSRFSVPFFFMVSGYFCFAPDSSRMHAAVMGRKVPHILKIILGACLFYLLFVLAQQFIWHDRDFSVNLIKLRNFILFNRPFIVAGQYWFLFALLYTYLLYAFMERCGLKNYEYHLAALMFVAYFCLAQGAHIIGVNVPNMYYRNWLIEGFAFFMLGHWTHEHRDSIRISNSTLLWIIALSTFMCLPERWVMGRDFGVNICTLPQVFALLVYAIKNPDRHEGVVQRIGKNCSMLVISCIRSSGILWNVYIPGWDYPEILWPNMPFL